MKIFFIEGHPPFQLGHDGKLHPMGRDFIVAILSTKENLLSTLRKLPKDRGFTIYYTETDTMLALIKDGTIDDYMGAINHTHLDPLDQLADEVANPKNITPEQIAHKWDEQYKNIRGWLRSLK